jgi:hypothetical protein
MNNAKPAAAPIVADKWKEIAVLHHMQDTSGQVQDWAKIYDVLVGLAAGPAPKVSVDKFMEAEELSLNDRYSNEYPLTVIDFIENMAIMMQANEAPTHPLAAFTDGLLSLATRLDDTLRAIRSEEIDGSEPEIGKLLEQSEAFLSKLPVAPVPVDSALAPRDRGMTPGQG